jgi:hypothetical protein
MLQAQRALSITASDNDAAVVHETLALLPVEFVKWIELARIDVRVLEFGEKFVDVAKRYKCHDSTDFGIVEGLYAMADRQVIIKRNDPAVLAHELFHVADFLLGDGDKMRSQLDDRVAKAYRRHDRRRSSGDGIFISSYASVNQVEFVAETGRAALGFSEQPPGRPHDLERLKLIDPELVDLVQSWLADIKAKMSSLQPAPS